MTIEVSVVVPTFNRPQLWTAAWPRSSPRPSTRPPTRSSSPMTRASESTRRQVEEWRSRFLQSGPAIHYLPCAHRGPAAARNAGWRARARAGDRLHRRRLHSRAGVARGRRSGHTRRSDWGLGTRRRANAGGPTDYERNAAGLATAEFVTANCFYRRRHSRPSAASTSASPWPGGRIAISG